MPIPVAEFPDTEPKRLGVAVANVDAADQTAAGRARAVARSRRWATVAIYAVALGCAVRLWSSLLPFATAVSLPSDPLWIRDFVQDYLLARVTLDRRDPYELISTLARDYLPAAVERALPNPTPHPPTLIPFVWPLGLVSYEVAALLWLGVQLLALVVVSALLAGYLRGPRGIAPDVNRSNGTSSVGVGLVPTPRPTDMGRGDKPHAYRPATSSHRVSLGEGRVPALQNGVGSAWGAGTGPTPTGGAWRWFGRGLDGRRVAEVAGVLLLLHIWSPVAADILQGQLMLVTAALLLLGWRAFRRGRPIAAGAAFGVAASIKLLPGLLLLYFLARREYRVVVTAALVGIAALAASLLWLGPGVVERYLFYALPATSDVWLGCRGNYSVFGAVARSFGASNEVLALVDAPALVSPIAVAISFALVAAAVSWAASGRDAGDGEIEMAIFVVVMLLVFPITWSHYLVLLAWPLAVVAARIRVRGWARRDAILALVIAPHVVVQPGDLVAMGVWLFGSALPADRLPPGVGLLTLIPTIGLFALVWLLWRERAMEMVPRRSSASRLDRDRGW